MRRRLSPGAIRWLIVGGLVAVVGAAWLTWGVDALRAAPRVEALTTLPALDPASAAAHAEGRAATTPTAAAERPPELPTTTALTLPPRPRTSAAATREDPVAVGEVVEFPAVWDIAVGSVDLDAATTVAGFAEINPPSAPDERYVLIEIEGTFLGERIAQPVFEWAVLSGNVEYRPWVPGCGVLPDSLYDVVELRPGESFRGQLCMPVETAHVEAGLVLYLQLPGDEAKYFDLTR